MRDVVAIVPAAGTGERLGCRTPKALIGVAGRPLLAWAVEAVLACPQIGLVIVAAPPGFEDLAHAIVESMGSHAVVAGGPSRHASVRLALEAVPAAASVIVCHDAARPLARPELFSAVIEALHEWDGVVPAVPVPDTVKRVKGDEVLGTEPRHELRLAQTPQAFASRALRAAHARAAAAGIEFTDDAAALEWGGYRVGILPGDATNLKVTTAEDLARAEELLRGRTDG